MTFSPERLEEGVPMLLAGIRQRHDVADAGATVPAQWLALAALVPLAGQRGTTTFGVVCRFPVATGGAA